MNQKQRKTMKKLQMALWLGLDYTSATLCVGPRTRFCKQKNALFNPGRLHKLKDCPL